MSSSRERWRAAAAAMALLLAGSAWAQGAKPASSAFPGIGRAATPAEIRAWDIDVRPDFKGLPPGRGSVLDGQKLWEAQCASCHGIFGESNEVFSPIAGGTGKDDLRSGRVARLRDEGFPQRTTMMKLSSVSTLWDYIHRAMPWNAPKTLKVDEVYAVTAFVLNLGGVVDDNFVLSHENIREVQARLPNRDGKTTAHAMWPGPSPRVSVGATTRPDVQGSACMTNCAAEPKLASLLPEHARNAHGNLAEQQRFVGAQVGADTTKPAPAAQRIAARPAPPTAAPVTAGSGDDLARGARALAQKHNCLACHGVERRGAVGPGFREIHARHAGRADAADYFAQKIAAGVAAGTGLWGHMPMPPQSLPAADLKALSGWMAGGAR